MQQEFDVIVAGAGGSGLAAAYSAAQHGGKVLVLEKRSQPGGTTGIAVGSFTAAGTSLQREANIEDDVLSHAEDAAKFPPPEIEARNNAPLRAHFLRSRGIHMGTSRMYCSYSAPKRSSRSRSS